MIFFRGLFLVLFLTAHGLAPAWAGETLVNSEVSVDVTGENAADARAQARAKGEADALTDLLNKLGPAGQAEDIVASLDARKISAMVRGTEILDEKMTSNRYRATLLISFDADELGALIGRFTIKGQEESAATGSFLILPGYDNDGIAMLWEEKNPWQTAWKTLGLEIASGDIVVPYGDANDINVVDAKTLASATYSSLVPLTVRYGVSDIVILQAKYTSSPDMTLTVVKRRVSRSKNEVNMMNYRADPQETRDTLMARAARDIVDNLQNKKVEEVSMARGGTHGGERNKVMVLASITTMASWTDLRAKIQPLPMIDNINMLAISPKQIDMVINYRGSPESLANAITAQQIRLVKNKDYWVISRD